MKINNNGIVIEIKKALLIGLFIIIFCCSFELITYYNSSKVLFDSICKSYVNRAIDNSKLLSDIFKEKLLELQLISEEEDIRSMDWERQKKALLKHIGSLNVKKFRVINKNGMSKSTDDTDIDLSDREFFKIALLGTENISDVLVSKLDKSLIVSCATPIRDYKNNIIGVLSCTVDYKMLSNVINNIKVGQEGYATLINYQGKVVAHPDRMLLMETISDKVDKDPSLKALADIEKRKINGETGFGFYKYGDISKFQAYAPVQNTKWILGLTISEKEAFNVLNSLKKRVIMESVVFTIIALLLSCLIVENMLQKKKVEDLKKNADESNRHLAEVTELDSLRTEFFANITHELRTPINVIYGTLQLIEHSMNNVVVHGTKDIHKRIKSMKQNCFRLLRLVNNLIDATKIDAGYLELNLENDDIVHVVENITLSVADYIKDKGIDLVFDTQIEEKIMAFDHDKIERIILNLLSNATKFTNINGSILVNIYDREDRIAISVRDTGIGIPDDKQSIIFERFRQANQSLTRSHEGSGIGLSLVKSLVEMHGGKITVESKYGKGSEFVVELPVRVLSEEIIHETNSYYKGSQSYVDKIFVEFSDIYI